MHRASMLLSGSALQADVMLIDVQSWRLQVIEMLRSALPACPSRLACLPTTQSIGFLLTSSISISISILISHRAIDCTSHTLLLTICIAADHLSPPAQRHAIAHRHHAVADTGVPD